MLLLSNPHLSCLILHSSQSFSQVSLHIRKMKTVVEVDFKTAVDYKS
jgi:hypothetical protein